MFEYLQADSCFLDPRYQDEVSGCTASVGIISQEKIFVVGLIKHNRLAVCLTYQGQLGRLKNCTRDKGQSETSVLRPQTPE